MHQFIRYKSQSTCNLHTGDTQNNMQPSNYYDEEDPLGDDEYIQSGGEDGSRSSRRPHVAQQQQFPWGSRFPPPPTWTPVPAQQYVVLPKVKLPSFWPKDPNS